MRRFVSCELKEERMVMQMRSIGLRTAHVNNAIALAIAILPNKRRFVDETVLGI